MKVIFQNFSAEQQGRGQALYSTMWGLGGIGSLLAGHYWQILSGATIFLMCECGCSFRLDFGGLAAESN